MEESSVYQGLLQEGRAESSPRGQTSESPGSESPGSD
jgi:hypothetical protein